MTLPSSQDFRLTSVLMSLYSVKDHSARHSADERYTLQKTKNKNKNKTKTKQKSQKKNKNITIESTENGQPMITLGKFFAGQKITVLKCN